jgi:hypothetical protein
VKPVNPAVTVTVSDVTAEDGLRVAVQAVLVGPATLFRVIEQAVTWSIMLAGF